MTASWSTVQLAEFLEVFEVLERAEIERLAVDRIAQALDAEVAALILDGVVVRCLGFPADRVPVQTILELGASPRSEVDLETIGPAHSVSVPVGGPSGELVVVRVDSAFDRDEEVLLRSMGRALGIALTAANSLETSKQLATRLRERHDLSSRMFKIQRSISHRAPLQEVLDSITQGAAELLSVQVVGLRVRAIEDDDESHASLLGYSPRMRAAFATLPLEDGFAGRAYSENRLIVSADYRSEPQRLGVNQRHQLEVAMAAPVHRNGEPVGVINVASNDAGRQFTEAEQEILLGLAEHASLAVNDATAVHQLRRSLEGVTFRARHDGLTQLLNRESVTEALELTLARATESSPVSVLFVDLDRFKLFNDMYGHAFGDQVLVEVADRLRSVVRADDYVARLSGDEFVIVAPGLDGDTATRLALRVAERVQEPFTMGGRDVELTISIGVAEATNPSPGEQLLANADLAMYRAKQHGRAGVVRFDQEMRSELFERAGVERELIRAIRSGELVAHFQPCVDLQNGAFCSFEALARWNHPQRGLLMPDSFIPVAEESGLVVEIDRLILDEACGHLARWSAARPYLTMSVNLSARQFTDFGIVEVVRDSLVRHGIDGSRLWLEITESVVLGEDSSTLEILEAIRALGVRFMIDDFGTGYSSLVYLKRFPVGALKIDRAFVDGLGTDREDEAIVTTIMRLAEALGHEVVAEGVENEVQAEFLRLLGCTRAQGFLYSRPVTASEITRMLGDGTAPSPRPSSSVGS